MSSLGVPVANDSCVQRFAGVCKNCNGTTYAIKGDPVAAEALMMALSESAGEAPLIGVQ